MESEPNIRTRRAPAKPGQSTIILAATGLAIIAAVALPMLTQRQEPASAAEDARAAYVALMAQMGSSDQEARAPAVADSSAGAQTAGRLERDLFAPAPRRAVAAPGETAGKTPAAGTAARLRPPKLSGIFIDGDQARAVIGGQVVAVGERVKDFQVIEIHANWVLLKRGDQVEKLELGGGR